MAIRQPLSTGTSESSIIFYNGGHNHDGISSARIDTAKYSFYDFTANFSSIEAIRLVQEENSRVFRNVISEIVKTSVLGPSGITLSPNSVRAENISAGAVGASELAANIVLVNNIISSSNYVANVSGWAISSNGIAEFANTSIRGTITADSLTTPGINIDSAGNLTANNFALYSNGAISTPGIDIDSAGNLNANNFNLYANGAIYASGGNFQVSAAGILSATGASITGTIEASSLVTPGLTIEANGDLTSGGGATVLFADGSIVTSSGNFEVDVSGNLYANNAIIYGEINATSGSIDGDLLVGGTISSTDIFGVNISGVNIDGSTITVGGRIVLPSDGTQISLGTASGGSATQVTIYDGGYQGMKIDTSGSGSTQFSGSTWYVNNQEFVADRYISGLQTFTGSGTTLVVSAFGEVKRISSKRGLKNDIQDFSDISLIDKLRPVTFTWKQNLRENREETEDARLRRESSINIGFIAEEVEEASDGLLSVYNYNEGGEGEVEMYKYLDIIALSVANIKDLRSRVAELESRLTEIEG